MSKSSRIILSIVIPHYNCPDTLRRLIESVGCDPNVEILVVDDGSDAHHLEAARLVCEGRARLLPNPGPGRGAGACRNIGMAEAVGSWLAFADADDYFVGGGVAQMLRDSERNVDVVFYTPTSLGPNGNGIGSRHHLLAQVVADHLLSGNSFTLARLKTQFVVPWSKLIRRSLIVDRGIRFDEVLASNDVMFSVRLNFALGSLWVNDTPIYCVTQSDKSLTGKRDIAVFKSQCKVYAQKYWFVRQNVSQVLFDEMDMNAAHLLKLAITKRYGLRGIAVWLRTVAKHQIRPIPIGRAFRRRVRISKS